MAWFRDPTIAAVSPTAITDDNRESIYAGLDPRYLPRRAWLHRVRRGDSSFPSLCGGFFRKQVLQSLRGWIGSREASIDREVAEAEMALAICSLAMRAVSEPESQVRGPKRVIEGRMGGYALGFEAGRLALAYSQLATTAQTPHSFAARLTHLVGGLVNPTSVAERLGWVLGSSDRSRASEIRSRIERAHSILECQRNEPLRTYRRVA